MTLGGSNAVSSRWSNQKQPNRSLSIHEYLSMELMEEIGIKVPKGKVARTPEEAYQVAKELSNIFLIVYQ